MQVEPEQHRVATAKLHGHEGGRMYALFPHLSEAHGYSQPWVFRLSVDEALALHNEDHSNPSKQGY